MTKEVQIEGWKGLSVRNGFSGIRLRDWRRGEGNQGHLGGNLQSAVLFEGKRESWLTGKGVFWPTGRRRVK